MNINRFILLVFVVLLCCRIMYLYVLSSMLECPLRFPLKKRRSICLLPHFVYRRAHVLFTFCVLCFLCLRLVYPLLPVFLPCILLIVPTVFFIVYLTLIIHMYLIILKSPLRSIIMLPLNS